MNDHLNDNSRLDLDPETQEAARNLNDLAEHIHPDPAFASNLEQRLAAAHPGSGVASVFSLRRLAPAFVWVLAIALMAFILDWAIRSLAPEPVPAARSTRTVMPSPPADQSTPVPSGQPYDWHGTTLYLATSLPNSPAEAGVYLTQPVEHATVEEAMTLAARFGIQGDAYETPGELPGTTDYMVTDGKQSLRVRSSQYFSYTADVIRSFNYIGAVQNPDADTIIGTFLQSHGFSFRYRMEWSDFRGAYMVEPFAPDGIPLRYERYAPPMLLVTLDQDGQVASMQASLPDVQSNPVGQYGILSAEEVFQELLDPNRMKGMTESVNSVPAPIHQWRRTYPLDQALTIYGNVSSSQSVTPGRPAFIQIDGYPAVGQVSGLDAFSQLTYVQATGQFISENGIEKFNLGSWKVSPVNEDGLTGTVQRENGQTTIAAEDGAQYILPDVPDDVPMPLEKAYVIGTKAGDTFQWKLIDDRAASGGGGGGGGGGGSGFYKLNLTGTPVPFPTATQTSETTNASGGGPGQYTVQADDTLNSIAASHGITADQLMQANRISDPNALSVGQTLVIPAAGTRPVEGLRGILSVTISKQQDGSQLVAYGFLANATSDPGGYMLLDGKGLEALQGYNNRPVDIWGALDTPHGYGIPVVNVDRYEIPFPNLQFQILHGTQQVSDISGQPATLFTTDDGKTYVQLLADGTTGISLIGSAGDQVQIEALAVPGESLSGYPALRVFGGALAINPKNGQPMQLAITADKPAVLDLPPIGKPATAPTATIEKVELVYFLSDPRYSVAAPGTQPLYFQPVWRFYGHYSTGDEFEVLIQALRDEYLLPELEPSLQPG